MMPKKNPGFRVRIPIQILGAASSVGRGTFLVPFRKARTDICTVLSAWSCVFNTSVHTQGCIYSANTFLQNPRRLDGATRHRFSQRP